MAQQRRIGGRFDPTENAAWLSKYQDVEFWMFRLLARWLPRLQQWEVKVELGKHLWEEAQHVDALWRRRRELVEGDEGPPRQNPRLGELFALVENGTCPVCFIASVHGAIKPSLLRLYQAHIELTDPISDAPTVRFLKSIVQDERAQISWGGEALARFSPEDRCGAEARTSRRIEELFVAEYGEFPQAGPHASMRVTSGNRWEEAP